MRKRAVFYRVTICPSTENGLDNAVVAHFGIFDGTAVSACAENANQLQTF